VRLACIRTISSFEVVAFGVCLLLARMSSLLDLRYLQSGPQHWRIIGTTFQHLIGKARIYVDFGDYLKGHGMPLVHKPWHIVNGSSSCEKEESEESWVVGFGGECGEIRLSLAWCQGLVFVLRIALSFHTFHTFSLNSLSKSSSQQCQLGTRECIEGSLYLIVDGKKLVHIHVHDDQSNSSYSQVQVVFKHSSDDRRLSHC
jgi:hypothetical protein